MSKLFLPPKLPPNTLKIRQSELAVARRTPELARWLKVKIFAVQPRKQLERSDIDPVNLVLTYHQKYEHDTLDPGDGAPRTVDGTGRDGPWTQTRSELRTPRLATQAWDTRVSGRRLHFPVVATVAAKTKAAREIISLKSSSKLHPGCPMAAGPGDCAGVLIHLKAEDLCCCFQGA